MPVSPITASNNSNNYAYGTIAWFLVVASGYLVLLAILAGPHFFGHKVKSGDIAEQTLLAPVRALVVDEAKTKEQAELAKLDVFPVLAKDKAKSERILSRIDVELKKIQTICAQEILPFSDLLTPEEQSYLLGLDDASYQSLISLLMQKDPLPAPSAAEGVQASVFEHLRSLPLEAEKPKARERGGKTKAAANGVQTKKQKSTGKQKASDKQTKTSGAKSSKDAIGRLKLLQIIGESRKKYRQLAARALQKSADKELLLICAQLPMEESDEFLKETAKSMRRYLSSVSLQPHADRQEWEEQIYEFLPDRFDATLRRRTASWLSHFLESNVAINQAATEEKHKNAVASVAPVMKQISKGEVVARKGDTLSKEQVRALAAVGIKEVSNPGLATVIAIALFAAYLLFGVYLYTYESKLFYSPSALALMSTVSIISCIIALFIGSNFPQFVPVSATTLILNVIYKKRLSLILSSLIVLFLWVSDLMAGPHLVALAAGAAMALGANIKHRKDLMPTGILIGLAQAAGYSATVILTGASEQSATLAQDLPAEMLGGLISAIAAIGSLPFLENIFGVLTPYRIAELAEPDQPLMRQLEENAPGTYQHSLAVANLAEGGARAIGADVNLVHTGAMYHDIGKMVTPRYFIENQLGDKNPHDYIAPEESRAKVLAHVTNGIALAQKYGLPKAVQAFIPEHQGTTVMAYFYHKATVRDGAGNVDINQYRYPGPKPQCKESAIVMLADVSEAVTHSMQNPTMEEVEKAISNVFKARWDDGQFSESGLSSDELEKVRKGFVRVWRTLHHDRLKYPATTTGRMPVVPVVAAEQPERTETNASPEENSEKPLGSAENPGSQC